jgi:hypothetical protein
MNTGLPIDQLKSGQLIHVQDAVITPGKPVVWSRERGTRISIYKTYVHSPLRHIHLTISGSGSFRASDFNSELQCFVTRAWNGAGERIQSATRIVGFDQPWREVRHPDFPQDAKKKVGVEIQNLK